ncbi:MAG TPA: hypothetical protein VHW26_09390, partial [Solirubrobacteraceae bacterium]|nr:hypothetical protein [Solirubrobacteraceae bacterium]
MATRLAIGLGSAGGRAWKLGGLVATVGLATGVAGVSWGGRNAGAATRTAGPAIRATVVPGVTATASPAEIGFGSTTTVSGVVTGPTGVGEAGALVGLERDAYPYAGYETVEHATTGGDGSYAFGGLIPDRDTRYEVVDVVDPSLISQPVGVVVDTPVLARVTTLAHGELRITATAEHSRAFDWNDRRARWYVTRAGARRSRLVASTVTREVVRGTTRVSASFYPPSGPFTYRVCFGAAGAAGLGVTGPGGPCEVRGASVGHPSAAVPSASEISSAEAFVDGRVGRTGFAVVDTHGTLSGVRMHEQFHSASLIKAMLLVAFLRRLGDAHAGLTDADRDVLEPMIHISDNDA